jgi:hypothetical protein
MPEAFSVTAVTVHQPNLYDSRFKEALIEAIGQALAAVSVQDVWGFFVHCGYRTPA